MSEPKLISPMLDDFAMGGPISDHDGVRCCPAMRNGSDERYIVKIISVPASSTKLEALLLTGAYSSKESAVAYFKDLAEGILEEKKILDHLAQMEGFVGYEDCQIEPMEDGTGFDVYLLAKYRRSLARQFSREPMTHLGAVNLGLDLCAALAVARRAGYLCVDIKPGNIFLTGDKEYRIGDLGFIKLNSLKYASLPDKYRSEYTAPEVDDAFAAMSTGLDIFAVGLILYQAYNNGDLPFTGKMPEGKLDAPAYADYEMAEIILKACDPDPAQRWEDPVQMGQALVDYMQRNGANDIPIAPPKATVKEAEPESAPKLPKEYTEEEIENLAFLEDDSDDTVPNSTDANVSYDDVTDEVSAILGQIDALTAHPVPDPVVAPEAIEVKMPEAQDNDSNDDDIEDNIDDTSEMVEDIDEEESEGDDDTEDEDDDEDDFIIIRSKKASSRPKRKSHWLRNTIIILAILALLAGGYFFYKFYYLQTIDSLTLQGSEDYLKVLVETEADESLLSVICTDTTGNKIPAPVVDGVAVFTGLTPDTAYRVEIEISGFHKLEGAISKSYSTPEQTNIVHFSAITGAESGSVNLGFTVDGPDSEQWNVYYAVNGGEERMTAFPGHMVTLTGLNVGEEYTFRLEPVSDLYIASGNELVYTLGEPVYAENVQVLSCADGKLSIGWSVPSGKTVSGWSVRCYNEAEGYDQTITTTETTATFEGLDDAASFNIDIIANGMSIGQPFTVPANSITATDFAADTSDPEKLIFTWKLNRDFPADGLVMSYTIDGVPAPTDILCADNRAEVLIIPESTYEVTLKDAAGNVLYGGPFTYSTGKTTEFKRFTLSDKTLSFKMCKTPSIEDWDHSDLTSGDYTHTFAPNGKASLVGFLPGQYNQSDAVIHAVYAIYNDAGELVCYSTNSEVWRKLIYKNYLELDIPTLPSEPGKYTLNIYFNGYYAGQQKLTISG